MTTKRYLGETNLTGVMRISELIAGDLPIVRFEETWFHPQGGGQKGDRGILGDIDILDVRYGADQTIDHFVASLDGLSIGESYPFAIDAEWRRLNSNLHSAGHLLSGVCEELFTGTRAIAGHHWPGECRVDFEGPDLDRMLGAAADIEAAANRHIQDKMPFSIVGDPYVNRAVSVGPYRPIACGGTHATTAADLGKLKIRSVKRKSHLVRVSYELRD